MSFTGWFIGGEFEFGFFDNVIFGRSGHVNSAKDVRIRSAVYVSRKKEKRE